MSAALILPPEPGTLFGGRKRWTRTEMERLTELGAFDGQRWELIEGDLFDKMGQKPPHIFTLGQVADWLSQVFGASHVIIQSDVEMLRTDNDTSLPQPDVAVRREPRTAYANRYARGDELLLVVEVSDTSLRLDMLVKTKLYARSNVPEYWVVDLANRRVIVYRKPHQGDYAQIEIAGETGSISPLAKPDASTPVSALLPPAEPGVAE